MTPINIQPIEKRRQDDDGSSIEVHSIFYTIQGEGPFTGHPAVFVRLTGCNLQCPSCDTEYTEKRIRMDPRVILLAVGDVIPQTAKCRLVVITGGEPFRQNITELARVLTQAGYSVQVETNGTMAPSVNFPIVGTMVVCSPKTGKVHPNLHQHIAAYKYVLDASSVDIDGLPILALNHTASPRVARPHAGFNGPVYLQPMDPKDDAQYITNVRAVKQSCLKFGYVCQLQVHKIIGVE